MERRIQHSAVRVIADIFPGIFDAHLPQICGEADAQILAEQPGKLCGREVVLAGQIGGGKRFNINFEWVPINERNYDAYKIVVQQVQADEDAYNFVTLHDTR